MSFSATPYDASRGIAIASTSSQPRYPVFGASARITGEDSRDLLVSLERRGSGAPSARTLASTIGASKRARDAMRDRKHST